MWRRTELRFREILAPLMPATRILDPDFFTPEDAAEGVCCGRVFVAEGKKKKGKNKKVICLCRVVLKYFPK
jgi:hypothetical protein